jgi:hypothetical protein
MMEKETTLYDEGYKGAQNDDGDVLTVEFDVERGNIGAALRSSLRPTRVCRPDR